MGFNSTIYKAAADLMYERRLNAEKSADRFDYMADGMENY